MEGLTLHEAYWHDQVVAMDMYKSTHIAIQVWYDMYMKIAFRIHVIPLRMI